MSTPGSLLQNKVLKYLEGEGVFAWRQNNQPTYDPKIGGYRSHNGMKGVPDIIAVINGVFIGAEIKAGSDKMSADQLLFQRRLTRAGGKYFIIKSVDDAKKMLHEIRV